MAMESVTAWIKATGVRLALAFVAFSSLNLASIWAIRKHFGITVTGDEPAYLVSGLSLGKFHSVAVERAYAYVASNDMFGPFGNLQQVFSHNGVLYAFHPIGLPLLIALPTTWLGIHGAELTLALVFGALEVALLSAAIRLSPTAKWTALLAGVVFLNPAFLIEATQFYPDLLTGFLLAIIVLTLARAERFGSQRTSVTVLLGLALAFLPWLHLQNVLYLVVIDVAVFVLVLRTKLLPRVVVAFFFIQGASLVLEGCYDVHAFGHVLGPPGEVFDLNLDGFTRTLALLFDRQQGLFVQFPVSILALSFLWVKRRAIPTMAIASVVLALAVIAIGGTFHNSYGGYSFVGRFQWDIAPLFLGFAATYLVTIIKSGRSWWWGFPVGILVVSGFESLTLLNSSHAFFSVAPSQPGVGWWYKVEFVVPSFSRLGASWQHHGTFIALFLEVVVVALATWIFAKVLATVEPNEPKLEENQVLVRDGA